MNHSILRCQHLHQPDGWLSPGWLHVDEHGMIVRVAGSEETGEPGDGGVREDAAEPIRLDGWVIPGMSNVHSHAFQRALVGRAEHRGSGGSGDSGDSGEEDSFWTWRTEMYRLALTLAPEDLQTIASQLYVEMLEAGMTAVGEFHYLHHDRDGSPYSDRAEMSHRIAAAAQHTGIGLTHLPVLYMTGGFGVEPGDPQRRFVHRSTDEFFRLVDGIAVKPSAHGLVRLGIAPHSLRAVPGAALFEAVDAMRARDGQAPIHIHIAEQEREVEQAVAHLGARPVRWLLDAAAHHGVPANGSHGLAIGLDDGLDARWCLIHATHLDDSEVADLARSQAIAGLCPTTEANLGDGIFRAVDFLSSGGRIAIGSDSHVTVDVADELRTLEYGQRLLHRRRNLLAGTDQNRGGHGGQEHVSQNHVARHLFDAAARWGAESLDQPVGQLIPGRRADLVVLDPEHPRLAGHGPDTVLDAWIFGAARRAIREVWVAGRPRVQDGAHVHGETIARKFRGCIERLHGR